MTLPGPQRDRHDTGLELAGTVGRYCVATALGVWALQHLSTATDGPLPVGGPWRVHGSIEAVLVAIALAATSISLFTGRQARRAGTTFAVLLTLYTLTRNVPILVGSIGNAGAWSRLGELLMLAGVVLILAAAPFAAGPGGRRDHLARLGRVLFGAPMLVFTYQHFRYHQFVADFIVTSWIPFKVFWAYFVGVAFGCAAVSLVTGLLARWAAPLLALQFLSWVLILHLPRVLAAPGVGQEYTSLCVALAMGGGALALTRDLRAA